jgi:hypothetical protein
MCLKIKELFKKIFSKKVSSECCESTRGGKCCCENSEVKTILEKMEKTSKQETVVETTPEPVIKPIVKKTPSAKKKKTPAKKSKSKTATKKTTTKPESKK